VTNLNHEIIDGSLVLKPSRRIDASSAKAFEEDANALLDTGPKKVVIDASNLDYISSAGLRVILSTAKRLKSAGGALTFACAGTHVKEVLSISGFDAIFGLHDSVDAARSSLG
jgi:anti-anti-sigma factor